MVFFWRDKAANIPILPNFPARISWPYDRYSYFLRSGPQSPHWNGRSIRMEIPGAACIEVWVSKASCRVNDITPYLPGDAVAYLRVADGDQRFPFRPVLPGLFLIGQGRSCDLRLGLEEIPPIHSVIHFENQTAILSRVADAPELTVNGTPCSSSSLQHGDLIEIGDVRLAFYLCNPAQLQEQASAEETRFDSNTLLERIESELHLIDMESAGSERLQDLLKSAHEAADVNHRARTIRFSDYLVDREASQLQNATMEERIVAALTAQETRLNEICQVLEKVVQQQQLITTALESVVQRLDEASATQSAARRASA